MKSKKIILLVFLAIISYGAWNGRNLILGPRLKITSPDSAIQTITENPVTIKGTARNVAFISLNDRQIFVDDVGNFSEKVLLPSGLNTIKLFGRDRFGKTKTIQLSLYNPIKTGDQSYANSPPQVNIEASSTKPDL